MGMTMKATGLEELAVTLQELGQAAPGIAAASLYEGAGVMADSIWSAIQGIRTAPFKYAKEGTRLPSPEEKAALMGGEYGIAKFTKNGSEVTTAVGYNADGYVNVNFNHMSSDARTNYKDVALKNLSSNATSFLKSWDKSFGTNLRRGAQDQKPVGAIANAINSGTSFMQKQPFLRQGVSKGTGPAKSAINAKGEEMLSKITK